MSPGLAFVLGMIAMGVIWYLCEVDEEAEYDDDEDALDRHRFGRDDD